MYDISLRLLAEPEPFCVVSLARRTSHPSLFAADTGRVMTSTLTSTEAIHLFSNQAKKKNGLATQAGAPFAVASMQPGQIKGLPQVHQRKLESAEPTHKACLAWP